MATAVKVMSEQKRARYSVDYRTEVRALAERGGAAAAARELALYAVRIYQWRSKAAHERSVSDREHASSGAARQGGKVLSAYHRFGSRVRCGAQSAWPGL